MDNEKKGGGEKNRNSKPPSIENRKDTVRNCSKYHFIASILYLLMEWSSLPNRVPMHYNFFGEVDKWGSKGTIFSHPIIGAVLWIGLTILEKFPHVYNYIINLTEENIERQYKNGRIMVNVVKNEILIYISYSIWKDVKIPESVIKTRSKLPRKLDQSTKYCTRGSSPNR